MVASGSRASTDAAGNLCYEHDYYIYLMRNMRNGYTKIGKSKNPKFRGKTLQSEEPEIELICAYKTWAGYEKELHEVYANKRVRGEWFNFSESEILAVQTNIVGMAAEDDPSLEDLFWALHRGCSSISGTCPEAVQ